MASAVDSLLTDRQLQIIAFLAAGVSSHDIAAKLHLSYHTIRLERAEIRKFFDTSSMAHAVAQAIFAGLIELGEDGCPRPKSV